MHQRLILNNRYARFDTHRYHSCRETLFNVRVDIKLWQSDWSVKCRSRTPCHGACWKGMTRTIAMSGLTLSQLLRNALLCELLTDERTDGNLNACVAPCLKQVRQKIVLEARRHDAPLGLWLVPCQEWTVPIRLLDYRCRINDKMAFHVPSLTKSFMWAWVSEDGNELFTWLLCWIKCCHMRWLYRTF